MSEHWPTSAACGRERQWWYLPYVVSGRGQHPWRDGGLYTLLCLLPGGWGRELLRQAKNGDDPGMENRLMRLLNAEQEDRRCSTVTLLKAERRVNWNHIATTEDWSTPTEPVPTVGCQFLTVGRVRRKIPEILRRFKHTSKILPVSTFKSQYQGVLPCQQQPISTLRSTYQEFRHRTSTPMRQKSPLRRCAARISPVSSGQFMLPVFAKPAFSAVAICGSAAPTVGGKTH